VTPSQETPARGYDQPRPEAGAMLEKNHRLP
jgi:hypothetical protein